jgi:hypothetical protein
VIARVTAAALRNDLAARRELVLRRPIAPRLA